MGASPDQNLMRRRRGEEKRDATSVCGVERLGQFDGMRIVILKEDKELHSSGGHNGNILSGAPHGP